MKNLLIIFCLLLLCHSSNAQSSIIKAGVNFNAEISGHALDKINYLSYEGAYERVFNKRFSLIGVFGYAKRSYERPYMGQHDNSSKYYTEYINTDHIFTLEGRYYLTSSSNGLFFQAGIPFIYSIETDVFHTPTEINTYGNVYSYAICTIGGLGIKYPLTPFLGVEMSANLSPQFNFLGVDYGTSGFFKSSIALTYTFKSSSKK